MGNLERRALLRFAGGCSLGSLGFVQLNSSAAQPRDRLPGDTHAKAATIDPEPSRWMNQWIQRWKTSGRDVDGLLYLGRFADPTYFLTKEISWKPNADRNDKLPSITVPIGFVTDFASIPRAFWSLLRPDGDYAYAAVIHDYLYWTQSFTRGKSDLIFKLAMEDFKIGESEVRAIYTGVRAGGAGPWRGNAKLKRSGEKRVLKQFPSDPRTRWADYKKRADVFLS